MFESNEIVVLLDPNSVISEASSLTKVSASLNSTGFEIEPSIATPRTRTSSAKGKHILLESHERNDDTHDKRGCRKREENGCRDNDSNPTFISGLFREYICCGRRCNDEMRRLVSQAIQSIRPGQAQGKFNDSPTCHEECEKNVRFDDTLSPGGF